MEREKQPNLSGTEQERTKIHQCKMFFNFYCINETDECGRRIIGRISLIIFIVAEWE